MTTPAPSVNPTNRVFVAGANGYIGRAVVAELVKRGHPVVSFLRTEALDPAVRSALAGSDMRLGDVTNADSLKRDGLRGEPFDAFVSCLASRSGTSTDAWKVDHAANQHLLQAAEVSGARQFVLLSAICLQNPRLAFQQAKLAFEKELRQSSMDWSIVRPTAFFKSLAGQIPRLQRGKPFILFGPADGPACKPISERDVARFMAQCLSDPGKRNRILPVGGPGEAITPRQRGEMLFELLGRRPAFRRLPLALFDVVSGSLRAAALAVPALAEKAELARIGRYYATEPMLWRNPETGAYDDAATPSFGDDTLRAFYSRVLEEGMEGQTLDDQALF
jgi:divinyl chlorophyllide a 8-vinyl-reductase